MAKTIAEYLDWLDERSELLWPRPPRIKPLKATPYLESLPGIKGVLWANYGTLLRIDMGRLLHLHPQEIRMQVALEKTITEFNMWYSMSRKPGQPWEYMLQQYRKVVEDAQMVATKKKGDSPEINSSKVWGTLIERLIRNEYSYDTDLYGPEEELADKVAYFFHANLQGVEASEDACETLQRLMNAGIPSGVVDDGQVFTLPQLHRALRQQAPLPSLTDAIAPDLTLLSFQVGLRKPSPSFFQRAVAAVESRGWKPENVLYVTHRLKDDLAAAKSVGFRTALFVADKNSCEVKGSDVRQPEFKPDRLFTRIRQVIDVLEI